MNIERSVGNLLESLCDIHYVTWQVGNDKIWRTVLPSLFYYLYFILSSSQITRKDKFQGNPIWEQVRDPKKASSSQDDRNKRQGKKFQGHRLQSQAILSKNFGTPVITGNRGTSKSPPELRQTSGKKTRTRRQNRKPPKRSGGVTQAARTDKRDIGETLKSGFHKTAQIGHGWEASARKYLRCWTTPYKNKWKPMGGC